MNKIEIQVDQVASTGFKGYVYSEHLSEEQLSYLGYNRSDAPDHLEVDGEFYTEVDKQSGEIYVEIQFVGCFVAKDDKSLSVLDLSSISVDFQDLEEKILAKLDRHEILEDYGVSLEEFRWKQ